MPLPQGAFSEEKNQLSKRVLGIGLIVTFVGGYLALTFYRTNMVVERRTMIDAPIHSLAEQLEKWAQRLQQENTDQAFASACKGRMQAASHTSVMAYLAKPTPELMASEHSSLFTGEIFVVPERYGPPRTFNPAKLENQSYSELFGNILTSPISWQDQIHDRGFSYPTNPRFLEEASYVVVRRMKHLQMPAFAGFENKSRASEQHKGQGAGGLAQIGVIETATQKLLCHGNVTVTVPSTFYSRGSGYSDAHARADAESAAQVSLGAIIAIQQEIETIGLQLICDQISPRLCEAVRKDGDSVE